MTGPDEGVGTVAAGAAAADSFAAGANPLWGDDWHEVRRLWLLEPAVAHCNHGSYGAVPASVLAAQEQLRRGMAANPVRWFERELPERLAAAREQLAGFLGAAPGDVALVRNASAGISAVCQSLAPGPGEEVVSTDHTYGAVSAALDRLCARTGAVRVVAPVPVDSSGDQIVEILARHCSDRCRLLVLDQVTSPTARHFPVQAAAHLAHAVGAAILVDGAHALGMLPVDVPRLGVDFWVGNLHKWGCAPAGAAVLWVAPAWHSRMQSLVVSWGERLGFPACFDRVGTDDLSAWLVAPLSLHVLGQLGWERLRRHNEALVRWAQATVARAIGAPPHELRCDPGLSMAVVPLPAGRADAPEQLRGLKARLHELGVEAAVRCWGGRGAIRLSAHAYNQPADYERLAAGVRDFLAA